MRGERQELAMRLCLEALSRPAASRAAFLADACGGDETLRREIESLLAHEHSAEAYMERFGERPFGWMDHGGEEPPAPQRIAEYQVLSKLGAGGMGVVYRARDARLGREVAIKVLPPQWLAEPESRARFEREARVLAALNHPHIASIFGVADTPDGPALVLELVEGETLASRLADRRGAARSGLPLDEALTIAQQIADALEAAHDKGIVHRDLKPGNIMLAKDGTAKVLDFGVAKAIVELEPAARSMAGAATREGVVVGTPPYMSPEQAQGRRSVDKRTDIWAFGCVLFEMLTGRRAFDGETTADIIAAVLGSEPDWSALPADTPPAIHRLLRRCLRKNPRVRLADIADARLELGDAGVIEPPAAPTPHTRTWLPWSVAATAVLAALVLGTRAFLVQPEVLQQVSFQVSPPANTRLEGPNLALSPDGRSLAVRAASSEAPADIRLWVHTFATGEWRSLPAPGPVRTVIGWSPDSRSVAIFSGGAVRRVDVQDGTSRRIAESANGALGSWGSSNVIAFGSFEGLRQVPVGGGEVRPLTAVDPARAEIGHFFPRFLPDGRHFFYLRASRSLEYAGIYIGSLDAPAAEQSLTRVVATRESAEYAPASDGSSTGHLMFLQNRTLFAQRFDHIRRELIGEAVPVVERVAVAEVPGNRVGSFSTAAGGMIAYRPQETAVGTPIWVNRNGREAGAVVTEPLSNPEHPTLSPDGTRLALFVEGNLWIYDLAGRPPTRLTSDGGSDWPLWARDGRSLVFSRYTPPMRLLTVATEAGRTPEPVSPEGHYHPHGWSADGGELIAAAAGYASSPIANYDLVRIPMSPLGPPQPLVQTTAQEGFGGAELSPDGRWLAYTSDATGATEVWVQPYPGPGAPTRVSLAGGVRPVWAPDSRELFYVEGQTLLGVEGHTLMAVALERHAPGFAIPTRLFTRRSDGPLDYDAAADGRFVLIRREPPATDTRIHVVINSSQRLR